MRFGMFLRVSLGAVMVVVTVFGVAAGFSDLSVLPMHVRVLDAHTLVVHPFEGHALPAGIEDGDRIDLGALDQDARAALGAQVLQVRLPVGRTYTLAIVRDGQAVSMPVAVARFGIAGWDLLQSILGAIVTLVIGVVVLLLLWRGRDPAAYGLMAWAAGYNVGTGLTAFQVDGTLAVVLATSAQLCFVGARLGFYVMAAALVKDALSPRLRTVFHVAFGLLLVMGSAPHVIETAWLAYAGSAEFMLSRYQLVYSWVYLVPVLMLALAYRGVDSRRRVRLRWAIVCGVSLAVSVTLTNTVPPGSLVSAVASLVLFTFTFSGMAYALLRHRVVDVAIVVDRTLVYGSMTALVVGVVAAVNSLALRAALPPGAGLLLQVVVPLALGIVLGKVRAFMDRVVEQVFFRRKYQAEKALRAFGKRAGHFDKASDLLEATAREVSQRTGTPALAIYSAESEGFRCLRAVGEAAYPEALGSNDDAVVALKAEGVALDLAGLSSALGSEGCVIPMRVLGNLRGLLVVKDRAGEHFGSDEKALLTTVAEDVGAAWRILRARENEALVVTLAQGGFPSLEAARAQAERLTVAWAGA